MKKIAVIFLVAVFVASGSYGFAENKSAKGASQKAMDNAGDRAIFNRLSDWFATIGKSEEEKEKIVAERQAKRSGEQAKKKAESAAKQAQKKIKDAGKSMGAK